MCNQSYIDRIFRMLIGAALIIWGVLSYNWAGLTGIIFLGTGVFGWCPIYTILGLNTGCKSKHV